MVPKADAGLIGAVPSGFGVVALCESAAGVVAAPALAASDGVVALMWGAEDLVASLGGTSSRHADGTYRDVARTRPRERAARRGGRGDSGDRHVHLDIDDLDGLRAEAEDAAASGFAATACIHPSHAAVIREAYRPTPGQIEHARRVLDAAGCPRRRVPFRGRHGRRPRAPARGVGAAPGLAVLAYPPLRWARVQQGGCHGITHTGRRDP
jgi:citrate lyase subunit beta/citryl-CoA lyase